MREVRSAGTGLQMLRKRDKDIQYLDFLPLQIQQDSAENTFLGFYLIIVSSQNLEDVL